MNSQLRNSLVIRPTETSDIPLLEAWDKEPHVISATTDKSDAEKAFDEDHDWEEQLKEQDENSRYYMAEISGEPVASLQIIDPQLEKTRYWGEMEPNLRAIDIWMGDLKNTGKGYGELIMREVFVTCFSNPVVKTIVIDPLFSNKRAIKFYKRIGFEVLERRLFHEEDDCLVLKIDRAQWKNRFPQDIEKTPLFSF